jgi:hypothetical protein
MKLVLLFVLWVTVRGSILEPHNLDFISSRNHSIIYADGTAKEILDLRQPIIQSWRPQRLEILNMCKTVTCDYAFIKQSQFPNRFTSNKCYLAQGLDCLDEEFNTLTTIEQHIHEADFATTIELGGEVFGLIGNSRTEDAVVLEVGVKIIDDSGKLKREL